MPQGQKTRDFVLIFQDSGSKGESETSVMLKCPYMGTEQIQKVMFRDGYEPRVQQFMPIHLLPQQISSGLVPHPPPVGAHSDAVVGGREARMLPLSGCLSERVGCQATKRLLPWQTNQDKPMNHQFMPISSYV